MQRLRLQIPVPPRANWGLVNRDAEGPPNADLRSGPLDPTRKVGTGALNLTVKDGDREDRRSATSSTSRAISLEDLRRSAPAT